ncbi:MAG: class I SAM-dependent methyltransferase [Anaerolineales bacterium]|nr:class I SAM-dependent methyltransferase [Anaerolineales bacterium]
MPFDHFDFIAGLYNRVAEFAVTPTLLRLADLPVDGRLLDAGGGTGRVAAALRSLAGQILVVDPSPGMLTHAAAKGLTAICAPAEQLPFPERSFDRIILMDTLHHVHDQARTAGELWRLLRPGGRIVIIEPDIHQFGVKLVALAEKLLLMRSHFLAGDQIAALFGHRGASVLIEIENHSVWVVVENVS